MPAGITGMSDRHHTRAAVACAIALLAFMVWISRDFGFTWDERFQQKYGEQIWDYMRGRLPRSSFDTDLGNQYLYGGLVELAAVAAQNVLRGDTYVVRHGVTSVFGWVGIVFTGLLAGRLFGRRAGWLAALLLATAPRFFADAMNNPKDAPFASLSMAVLYVALTIDWRPPFVSWRRLAALALVLGLAINVRPLGVILIAYAGGVIILVASWWTWRSTELDRWRTLGIVAAKILVLALVVLPLGTVAWPWAQASPYVRPLEGLLITSRLDWARGFEVLYNGQNLGAGSLPWSYVPKWLVMSLPPVVLAGVILSGLVWKRSAVAVAGWTAVAAFALTPVCAAIVRNATIYDGIRHLEFIVAPLIVLSAGGWSAVLDTKIPARRLAAASLLALGLIEPLLFQARNHPNQIVYFSPLMGGPRAAFARYDMDYWGNSVLQAVQWAARRAERSGFPIIVSGNPIQAVEADAARYRSLMSVPRASREYHFDIRLLRGPSQSVQEFARRPDVIHSVKTADGTPLCVVIPGPAYLNISDRLVWDE
jgi:hypothetical protein